MKQLALALVFWTLFITGCDIRTDGQRMSTATDLRNLMTALDMYKHQFGRLPTEADGLEALVLEGIEAALPADDWGNPYVYAPANYANNGPVVYSSGPNGIAEFCGGDDFCLP